MVRRRHRDCGQWGRRPRGSRTAGQAGRVAVDEGAIDQVRVQLGRDREHWANVHYDWRQVAVRGLAAVNRVDQVALLKKVKGVGTLIALTYVLTLDDPHRFAKSREVGCFLGLKPGRRDSGESQPQMHISKEGDRYLRTMLVQGAHYILGPFGADSDLRRWGLRLAERGGKNAKKRAVVAVARKLAVLLHRLWVSGEVYEPLRNNRKAMRAVA